METIFTEKRAKIILNSLTDITTLWFFGDVHRDTVSCDVDRWNAFLKKAQKDEGAYFVGMGDYHDFASSREQKHLSRDVMHETSMETIDEYVMQQNRKFAKEIGFMRNNLLGIIDGNHNWRFANGVTASEDLANRMGCEHLGWLCHYTLAFEIGNNKKINVYLMLGHGKAGGKLPGASINQLDDLSRRFPAADIYVYGHDHARGAWTRDVLIPSGNGKLKQHRQFLCRSGSFKKGYTEGKSSYEVGRLLSPADLGALKLQIAFHRDQSKGDRVIPDITAII